MALRPALWGSLPLANEEECPLLFVFSSDWLQNIDDSLKLMPNKRPVPLSELLQTGSLADLAAEAGRRESLTERIRGLLPPE